MKSKKEIIEELRSLLALAPKSRWHYWYLDGCLGMAYWSIADEDKDGKLAKEIEAWEHKYMKFSVDP